MDDPFVTVVPGKGFTHLLQGPVRRWIDCNVRVKNPPAAQLHDNEDVEDLKASRNRGQEVTSDDGFGVVAKESRPLLVVLRPAPAFGAMGEVFAYGPG